MRYTPTATEEFDQQFRAFLDAHGIPWKHRNAYLLMLAAERLKQLGYKIETPANQWGGHSYQRRQNVMPWAYWSDERIAQEIEGLEASLSEFDYDPATDQDIAQLKQILEARRAD